MIMHAGRERVWLVSTSQSSTTYLHVSRLHPKIKTLSRFFGWGLGILLHHLRVRSLSHAHEMLLSPTLIFNLGVVPGSTARDFHFGVHSYNLNCHKQGDQ